VIAVWRGVVLFTVGAAAITGGQPRTGSGHHGTQSTTSIPSRQAYASYAGLVAGIFVLFAATNIGNVREVDHRGAVTTGTVAQGVSVLSQETNPNSHRSWTTQRGPDSSLGNLADISGAPASCAYNDPIGGKKFLAVRKEVLFALFLT
jgi:hypothetical protein